MADGDASPLFPPQAQTAAQAKGQVLHVLHREPADYGVSRTRWRLLDVLAACPWLHLRPCAGSLSHLLRRLGISFQRARDYVHSPDPDYAAKLKAVQQCLAQVRQSHGRQVLLFMDEVSIYRQPSLAAAYAAQGGQQPLAHRSLKSNSRFSVVGGLDAVSGQVCYRRASRMTVSTLVAFYQQLPTLYPQADCYYVVQDNWPVHTHPDLLLTLQTQHTPFAAHNPAHWSQQPTTTAERRWADLRLPIQRLPLPTYASWCNPIEKLWRMLRQDKLHLHPWADDWQRLQQEVDRFLDQFAHGSIDLLRSVGLLSPGNLYLPP